MCPQDGLVPPPGSPFSMKVSARTQMPLTATTKSATDRPIIEKAQVGVTIDRSHQQPMANFWAALGDSQSSYSTRPSDR